MTRLCPACGLLHTERRCPQCRPAQRARMVRRHTGGARDTYAWRKLSQACISRDGYACQECGATREQGARLHAHHVVSRRIGGPDALENLITVCDRCHPRLEAEQRRREAT